MLHYYLQQLFILKLFNHMKVSLHIHDYSGSYNLSKPWSIQYKSLFYHAALLPQSHQLQESITATSQTVLQAQARPEPPRLTTLLNELTNRVSAKWEEIGISLRLESGLLEIIKEDNPKDCRACLRNVLKEWLKRIDPPPSWVAIIKAVKDAGYRPLARTLREKYLPNK